MTIPTIRAFLALCRNGQQGQWTVKRWPCQKTVPSLLDLAAVRTLATFIPNRSHYEVLGLTRSASPRQIREAFLKLSKECHPDLNKTDPLTHKKFVQVNEAYSVLSKPLSRRDYDITLDAQRYATRHMNTSAGRSHAYYYQPEAGHYYHRQGQFYDDGSWARHEYYRARDDNTSPLTNFYVITFGITCAAVGMVLHYMHRHIPNPKLDQLKKNLNKEEIQKHDLIMMSEHDGMTVYYYAVPKEGDPGKYEVLAVGRNQSKDSDAHELQELNNINYVNRDIHK